MLRSRSLLRCAAPLAAVLFITACTSDDRPQPLTGVEFFPPGATIPQNNQNIANPTLATFNNGAATAGDTLTLVWSDEFDGDRLDPEVWFFETGDGSQYGIPGWGNNELQYYLENSAQLDNGVLKITVREESVGGLDYTSARINTQDRISVRYGRIEASIKLPAGQGLWPAFWMLAQDSPYGSWPDSGEIDIVEAVNLGGTPGPGGDGGGNKVFGTIHYGSGNPFVGRRFTPVDFEAPSDVTQGFHTYAIEWEPGEIRWYFDDTLYAVQANWFNISDFFPAPFNQPFYIILNLAVGGAFPGSNVDAAALPATMEVEYVRVYSGDAATSAPIIAFPADFEAFPQSYGFNNFGGGFGFVVPNPDPSGINTSTQVLAIGKAQAETSGGVGYGPRADIDYADGEAFTVKVWSQRPVPVLLKLEGLQRDRTAIHPGGSTWQELCFDFTGDTTIVEPDFNQLITFIFDNGVLGNFDVDPDNWTFYVDDIQQTTSCTSDGGVAPGTTPDEVVFSSTGAGAETLGPPGGIQDFGSGAAIVEVLDDPDFGRVLSVTSGDNYDPGNLQVGFAAFTGYAAGFAAGFETLEFKVKGDAANLNNFEVKLFAPDDSQVYDLTNYSGSTELGNGWWQVSIPLSDFNAAQLGGYDGFLLGPLGDQMNTQFTFFVTDLGFSGTVDGGGDGDGTFVNGDFETGDFTGWTLTQIPTDRGSIALDTSGQGGRAGNVARLIAAGDAAGTNDVLISQVALAAGTVAPGDSIDVSFDLYGSLTGAGGVVFVEVIFLNGAGVDEGGRNFVGPAEPYVPSTTWTTYSGNVTAGTAGNGSQWDVSGGVTLQLKASCGAIVGGCGVDASFDNVTFIINGG